jgi:hypothetical protein
MFNPYANIISVVLTILGTVFWFGAPVIKKFTRTWNEPHNRIRRIYKDNRVLDAVCGAWKSSVQDTVLITAVTLIISGLLLPIILLFVLIIPIPVFSLLWLVRCIGVVPDKIHEPTREEWRRVFLTPRFWVYFLPLISLFIRKDT